MTISTLRQNFKFLSIVLPMIPFIIQALVPSFKGLESNIVFIFMEIIIIIGLKTAWHYHIGIPYSKWETKYEKIVNDVIVYLQLSYMCGGAIWCTLAAILVCNVPKEKLDISFFYNLGIETTVGLLPVLILTMLPFIGLHPEKYIAKFLIKLKTIPCYDGDICNLPLTFGLICPFRLKGYIHAVSRAHSTLLSTERKMKASSLQQKLTTLQQQADSLKAGTKTSKHPVAKPGTNVLLTMENKQTINGKTYLIRHQVLQE